MVRRPGFSDPMTVHSRKSTSASTGFFFALLGPSEAADIVNVRAALDLIGLTDAVVRVAYQVSDDGIWPLATDSSNTFLLPTAGQGQLPATPVEGVNFSTAWHNIQANLTKKQVRFGVWVFNVSGNLIEMAVAAIRIETRPQ